MSDLSTEFNEMKARFDPEAAGDLEAIFGYNIGGEQWHVKVANGECEIEQGPHEDADVTLTMEPDTFRDIMKGEKDGMQAFMAGELQADGDMMLAPQLEQIFPTG